MPVYPITIKRPDRNGERDTFMMRAPNRDEAVQFLVKEMFAKYENVEVIPQRRRKPKAAAADA